MSRPLSVATLGLLLLVTGCGGSGDPVKAFDAGAQEPAAACAALTAESREVLDALAADVFADVADGGAACADFMRAGGLGAIDAYGGERLPADVPVADERVDLLASPKTGWPVRMSAACGRYAHDVATAPVADASREGLVDDLMRASERSEAFLTVAAAESPGGAYKARHDEIRAALDEHVKTLTAQIAAVERSDTLDEDFDTEAVDNASNAIIAATNDSGLLCYAQTPDPARTEFVRAAEAACAKREQELDAAEDGDAKAIGGVLDGLAGDLEALEAPSDVREDAQVGATAVRKVAESFAEYSGAAAESEQEQAALNRLTLWTWRAESALSRIELKACTFI